MGTLIALWVIFFGSNCMWQKCDIEIRYGHFVIEPEDADGIYVTYTTTF